MITHSVIETILRQYQLSTLGIHGPAHWGRVLENGTRLAQGTGADLQVVELFAVFHDACRYNDDHDPDHGSRGAILAASLRGRVFELSDAKFRLLTVACRLHTAGRTEGDITVQTCWDADRLDLGRVGVRPFAPYLCTDAAKSSEILEWAHERAVKGIKPRFVEEEWLGVQVGQRK